MKKLTLWDADQKTIEIRTTQHHPAIGRIVNACVITSVVTSAWAYDPCGHRPDTGWWCRVTTPRGEEEWEWLYVADMRDGGAA